MLAPRTRPTRTHATFALGVRYWGIAASARFGAWWIIGLFPGKSPMNLSHWLPFAIASAVLVVVPGPTVLLVVSYALGPGRRYALATTAGGALGDVTSMTASMVGLGAMLAASSTWFAVLKWIGAAY